MNNHWRVSSVTWDRLSVIQRRTDWEDKLTLSECFDKFILLEMYISPDCDFLEKLSKRHLTQYDESKMNPVVHEYEMEWTWKMENTCLSSTVHFSSARKLQIDFKFLACAEATSDPFHRHPGVLQYRPRNAACNLVSLNAPLFLCQLSPFSRCQLSCPCTAHCCAPKLFTTCSDTSSTYHTDRKTRGGVGALKRDLEIYLVEKRIWVDFFLLVDLLQIDSCHSGSFMRAFHFS